MDAPRLYRFRHNAIGFTRGQLLVVIVALALAVAGVLVWALGEEVIAAIMFGIAGATLGLTTLVAYANNTRPPT